MNRTGLFISLSIGALVGLLFGVDPDLDVSISRLFLYPGPEPQWLGLSDASFSPVLRGMGKFCVVGLGGAASLGIVVRLVRPDVRLWVSTRAMTFLLVTVLLGPGVIVNATLKEHWLRPRPIDVVELGGTEKFVPWWNPRGECAHNCSFVAGDVSAAFWTVAMAVFTPPASRALAYGGALAFGITAALLRMATGAHFFTDVVFAGVLMFVLIWLIHGLMVRWPRTRMTEREAEDAIERIALWWRTILRGLTSKHPPRTDP